MKVLYYFKKNSLLTMVVLIYGLIFLMNSELAQTALGNSGYYLKEMMVVLPVIFLFTVVIEALVPKQVIIRGFGEKSGFRGNLLALMLGSLSAGPIYAAFPISKALLSKGASISNIVIILSSWAVVKVPMLANEIKFLGPQFMAVRWVLTVIAIFTMAYLTGLIVSKGDLPHQADETTIPVLAVQPEYCIGCSLCAELLPQYFCMEGEKAVVVKKPDNLCAGETFTETVEKCPGRAITYNDNPA